jgi:fatty acid amide hydrolase
VTAIDAQSPIHWSAAEIARRIARREIAARDVVDAFIARIEAVNPQLNAVVVPRFEQSRAEASAADAELSSQPDAWMLKPLLGVPITVKECFHLAGTPSTMGLDAPAHTQTRQHDGTLVARLRAAGAIVLGKTNLPQLMIWHESDNPVYGRTNNPWNLERTCGGSSGGEAAIIAARGSPLGLGNDLGGSIRIPCHFCGIHGLRPTSLRLPRGGAARTLRGFEAMVTQAGPMARHVEDLWLALRIFVDESDAYTNTSVVPAPLRDPAAVNLSKLSVAAWSDDGFFPPSAAVARAVKQAAADLRACGANVMELSARDVTEIFSPAEAFELYCGLVGADGGADARRLSRGSKLDPRVKRLMWIAGLSRPSRGLIIAGLKAGGQKTFARLMRSARRRSADSYWQLVERKNQLAVRILTKLKELGIEALLCPPHALPATPHVRAFDLLAAASYSLLINLLGLPSGTFSIARVMPEEQGLRPSSRDNVHQAAHLADQNSAGLPVGVQVSGLPWREDIVLAVMLALERASNGKPDFPTSCIPPCR